MRVSQCSSIKLIIYYLSFPIQVFALGIILFAPTEGVYLIFLNVMAKITAGMEVTSLTKPAYMVKIPVSQKSLFLKNYPN